MHRQNFYPLGVNRWFDFGLHPVGKFRGPGPRKIRQKKSFFVASVHNLIYPCSGLGPSFEGHQDFKKPLSTRPAYVFQIIGRKWSVSQSVLEGFGRL